MRAPTLHDAHQTPPHSPSRHAPCSAVHAPAVHTRTRMRPGPAPSAITHLHISPTNPPPHTHMATDPMRPGPRPTRLAHARMRTRRALAIDAAYLAIIQPLSHGLEQCRLELVAGLRDEGLLRRRQLPKPSCTHAGSALASHNCSSACAIVVKVESASAPPSVPPSSSATCLLVFCQPAHAAATSCRTSSAGRAPPRTVWS